MKLEATHIKTPALVLHDLFVPIGLLAAPAAADLEYCHRFGGPPELRFDGWPAEAPRPHQVIRLDLNDPALPLRGFGLGGLLPLAYPFRIDGCRMKFAVTGSSRAPLLELDGDRTVTDWPYDNYPPIFPTAPLRCGTPQPIDWDAIDASDDGYPMTWQDTRPAPGEALIIIPPNDAYGVSLWGEGDLEQVQLLFRIDLRAKTIEAWTECS